ncbi:hypothetical protein BCIN_10g04980 [Botrytis cinerea B05.10]|uniref:Cell wall protein n=2 Tax=Botryotinia fuckeliana TaxID=40559 RepID=A0A384JV64_BOTFB|nr:hypothetical protein BCIN_10g04980 [Botrytis cinerea B05.10]ATZ54499.1 hypothetical protein BCIN_10g04980 [Botrytis cinerea B05.10]EMR81440.1 hypothetical protein BcDW1_9940 [Botrytis cinerea BcDW1]
MQFSAVFLSLLAATAVVAKGNSTKPVTDKSLCKEMNKLEKLVDQAQNTTKLASKTNNNQTKIDNIVAKASAAAIQLDAMQANTTLVSTCAVIDAAQMTKKQCNKMEDLQKTIDTAGNSTKLAAKTKGNATKEAEYQAKATKAQTKLAEMTSNTTLVDACSALQTEKEAKKADTTTTSAATSSTKASGAAELVGARFGSVVGAGVLVAVGMSLL